MTTIAYKDGVLAADRLCDSYPGKFEAQKILLLKSGGVLAGAGDRADIEKFYRWYDAGQPEGKEPKLTDGSMAILIAELGQPLLYANESMFPIVMDTVDFYAIGSGSNYAIGAMAMGADAIQAVRVACQHEIYSGGAIQFIRVGETVIQTAI